MSAPALLFIDWGSFALGAWAFALGSWATLAVADRLGRSCVRARRRRRAWRRVRVPERMPEGDV